MEDNILKTMRILSKAEHYNTWIYRRIKHCLYGTVLDIGSGTGNIAQYFMEHTSIKRVIVSDKSNTMITHLGKKFSNQNNYQVARLDICDYASSASFLSTADVITCINVLEHLDDVKALVNMRALMRRGKTLLLIVPALPFLYGTLDVLAGHTVRYTKESLRQKLKQSGFIIKELCYFNCFGIITWFLASKILRQREFSETMCKALDKWVFVLEAIERCCCIPFGQSLLSICCKP